MYEVLEASLYEADMDWIVLHSAEENLHAKFAAAAVCSALLACRSAGVNIGALSIMQAAPLEVLSEQEALQLLWTGPDSIAKRAGAAIRARCSPAGKSTSTSRGASTPAAALPAGVCSSLLSCSIL